MLKSFLGAFMSLIVVSACSGPDKQINTAADVTASGPDKDDLVTLMSDTMLVRYTINEMAPKEWQVSPLIAPDTLSVECRDDTATRVMFASNTDSQTFLLSGQDVATFEIVVEDVKALTEIKCIVPRIRFRGSYSPDRKTAGEFAADLPLLLDAYFDDDRPGIIVSASKDGEPAFTAALGRSDMAKDRPRKIEETFDIASVTKEFTAVSILQLADLKKLTLADPISLHLEAIPNGDVITLHHLLTHTHGLAPLTHGEDYDMTQPLDVDAALDRVRKSKVRFEPGERYEYGNTAYFLLSLIADNVSGLDRKAYIQTNIFDPADMTQSAFITDTGPHLRVAGYNESGAGVTLRTFDFPDSHTTGTGDIVSTLSDMRKWQRGLADGTLISAEIFARATAPKYLNNGTQISRGYGFFRGQIDGELIIYNTGDLYTRTRHFYMPSRGLSVILNMNGSVENDGALPSIVFLQIIGRVLNRDQLDMFDESISLNEL